MDGAMDGSAGAEQLQTYFDSLAGEDGGGPNGLSHDDAETLIQRVGILTRTLHDSLHALGYDKIIEQTAAAIPDARDRLAYVTTMTQQAADRTLNSIDAVRPLQDSLAEQSAALSQRWDLLFARELTIEQFKDLVADTRGYLEGVPQKTATTNAQLLEIMMAQDFQDLTGQVIKKTTGIIHMVEQQLLQLLLDNIPREKRAEVSSMMNGPVINPEACGDAVTSQTQVDDLLESLGF